MARERIEEIDILRGMAFLAVVMQHVIAGIFYQSGISTAAVIGGAIILTPIRFAVPLFVFITGLVLFYNYDKFNYGNFMYKRFVQIFIPYFLWTIIFYLWGILFSGVKVSNIYEEINKIIRITLTGKASYHLWYMVMIFQFYITFPLFKLIINRRRRGASNLTAIIISLIIYIPLLYYTGKYGYYIGTKSRFLNIIMSYIDRNAVVWFFYFLLGGIAGMYIDKWRSFVEKTYLINIMFFSASLYLIIRRIIEAGFSSGDNKYMAVTLITAPLKPQMTGFLISSIILVYLIAQYISGKNDKIPRILKICGKYSFGGYLIHALVLRYTNWVATGYLGWISPFAGLIVSFALCSILSVALCCGISKIKHPFNELLVGKVK